MRYNEIQDLYHGLGLEDYNYQLRNNDDVKSILGWDITEVLGYKRLIEDDKKLIEKLIIGCLNSYGLKARQELKVISIERIEIANILKFKVIFADKEYSYLYPDGTVA